MKLFLSYTGLLRELAVGRVVWADLDTAIFAFGCGRPHAVDPSQFVVKYYTDGSVDSTSHEAWWFGWSRTDVKTALQAAIKLAFYIEAAEIAGRCVWRREMEYGRTVEGVRSVLLFNGIDVPEMPWNELMDYRAMEVLDAIPELQVCR